MQEVIKVSNKEIERLQVIKRVADKQLSQVKAGKILGLSSRQIYTLLQEYLKHGAKGLISKKRGNTSNRAYSIEVKNKAIQIIQDKYSDFGPTLASEYLEERHSLKFSSETIRLWMVGANIWQPKKARVARVHQPRLRRGNYGELIQIDGSPHDWFEGRSNRCCLIVFVDDATSKIQLARFFPSETTFAYFAMMKLYLQKYGKPISLYSDKYGVFRVNIKEPESGTGLTQFGRAMQELNIDLIHANSPQAKGKVERANGTLQDRLVKWLRIEGLSDMSAANANIDKFIDSYNRKFAVQPREPEDIHRAITDVNKLELTLCLQETRKVSKNLTVQYKNKTYAIERPDKKYTLGQAEVTVCEQESGEITLLYNNSILPHIVYDKNQYHSEPLAAKELPPHRKPRKKYRPPADHPWNRSINFRKRTRGPGDSLH